MKRFLKPSILMSTACLMSYFFYTPIVFADTVGQRANFFVDPEFDHAGRSSVAVTLLFVSERSYLYVEDAYYSQLSVADRNQLMSSIQYIAQRFDTLIHPKITTAFGSEPNPGIDGDSRLVVVLQRTNDTNGGYIHTQHFVADADQSNHREMVFLNVALVKDNPVFAAGFLAHEFVHVVSFQQKELNHKKSEDVWLNEMRAEYALTLLDMHTSFTDSMLARRAESFRAAPTDSLTEWPNAIEDYGIGTMFAEYIVDHHGEHVLTETMGYASVGISSLQEFFASRGTTFSEVFLDWMSAAYLNNASIRPSFSYLTPELQKSWVSPTFGGQLQTDRVVSATYGLKPWQPAWILFSMQSEVPQDILLRVQGPILGQVPARALVTYRDGSIHVVPISLVSGSVVIPSRQIGIDSVVVLATYGGKTAAFGPQESAYTIQIGLSWIAPGQITPDSIQDGDLIRKYGEKEVYVIRGPYKRYLAPEVIAMYGHLAGIAAKEVLPDVFFKYQTANYIKNEHDEKVYAVRPEGTKHWLNMTGAYFTRSGRDWGSVFVINDRELQFYHTGADVTR